MSPIDSNDQISNNLIYNEVIDLRKRVDKLESHVYYLLGGLGVIVIAIDVVSKVVFH